MTNDESRRRTAESAAEIVEDERDVSPEEWAEGCVALSPEVFPDENWDNDAQV